MIYKFSSFNVDMEIELSKAEEGPEENDYDTIMFSVKYDDETMFRTRSLKKEEVFDLIEVLLSLYKKMD